MDGGYFRTRPNRSQLTIGKRQVSVYNILTSYDQLLSRAVATRGRIDPFLQQLAVYDPRYIAQLRQDMKLSETMAIQLLKTGMMRGRPAVQIKRRVLPFIDPKQTLEHGRAIFREQVRECGLAVGDLDPDDPIWSTVWDLYIRYDHVMNEQSAKMVESATVSFSMPGVHREASS